MEDDFPRVASVTAVGPTTVRVKWKGKQKPDDIDLSGWIATGGDILAPLKDPDLFKSVELGDYGSAVVWDNDDLAIDAEHLRRLAEEQKPFGASEAKTWQIRVNLSNAEAASLFDISKSTWASYRAGAKIPTTVVMICRAIERDPLVLQAHYRPSKAAGRPRKRDAVA